VVIFAFDDIQCMPEIPELREFKIKGEKDPGSQKEDNKPGMPSDITVEHYKKFIYLLHRIYLEKEWKNAIPTKVTIS
jgi:hypothetical protein